jgi:tRNA(Ile)-lysidine synthase TilS/MesJ
VYIAEAQIREFAKQQGFARVTCRCPVGEHSMRMQVENMLKDMEKHFPHARSNLASVARRISSGKAGFRVDPIDPIEGISEEKEEKKEKLYTMDRGGLCSLRATIMSLYAPVVRACAAGIGMLRVR